MAKFTQAPKRARTQGEVGKPPTAIVFPNESASTIATRNGIRGVMGMFAVDASALIAVLVGFVAAVPAYAFTHQTARGRARGSIAYLSGLGFGVLATVFLFLMLQRLAFHLTFGEAALAGAFFGPFVGLLSGAWVRTGRKRRKARRGPF